MISMLTSNMVHCQNWQDDSFSQAKICLRFQHFRIAFNSYLDNLAKPLRPPPGGKMLYLEPQVVALIIFLPWHFCSWNLLHHFFQNIIGDPRWWPYGHQGGGSECQFSHLVTIGHVNFFAEPSFCNNHKRRQTCPNTMLDHPWSP